MPRIRTIKPDFWKSEKVATRLPAADGRAARQFFVALWNFAEDHGVCRGNPAYLRAEIFPYDDDVTPTDIQRWLGMLERGGFIVRFEREGSSFLWIRSFNKHQRIEKPSKPTLPTPSREEQKGIQPTPGVLPEPSPTPPEKKRMEGKGGEEEKEKEVEGKGRERSAAPIAPAQPQPPVSPSLPPLVERLCDAYQRERGAPYPLDPHVDGIAVRKLLALANGDEVEIERRLVRALRVASYPRCSTFTELATQKVWSNAASDPPARANPTSGRASDADKDHGKPVKTKQTQFGEELEL